MLTINEKKSLGVEPASSNLVGSKDIPLLLLPLSLPPLPFVRLSVRPSDGPVVQSVARLIAKKGANDARCLSVNVK